MHLSILLYREYPFTVKIVLPLSILQNTRKKTALIPTLKIVLYLYVFIICFYLLYVFTYSPYEILYAHGLYPIPHFHDFQTSPLITRVG